MLLGHKQKAAIEIGKKKGFITSIEALKIWSNLVIMKERMNGLVFLDVFKPEKDDGKKIIWEFNNGRI